jgi:phage terminase large subunit
VSTVLPTLKPAIRDPYYNWGNVPPPYVWGAMNLGLTYYDWQIDALDAFGQRLPVALAAANESGKTTYIFATAVLWFLDQFGEAGGQLVLTSGSWLQVTSQLAPAIRRFQARFPKWRFLDTEIKKVGSLDPTVIMFSTDSPLRAEGFHAKDPITAPLAYLVDESKGVPDGIFSAIDRCRPQYFLAASSPGPAEGRFYRMHTKDRNLYWNRKVRSDECPHIPLEKVARDLAIYGPDHPVFRSMHKAEFTNLEGRTIIPDDLLVGALQAPPAWTDGPKVAFCDFAAGRDENVLAIRYGNKAWIVAAWRDVNTIQAARHFIRLFEENNLTPTQIFGDESGLGHVMIDAMADEGWSINRVNFGASADDDEHYADRATEMWCITGRLIDKKEIILPNEDTLFAQLTDRKLQYASKGRLKAESKDDMKARGVGSPDRADAICGACACGPHLLGAITSVSGIRLAGNHFGGKSARFRS